MSTTRPPRLRAHAQANDRTSRVIPDSTMYPLAIANAHRGDVVSHYEVMSVAPNGCVCAARNVYASGVEL